jgi:hypothetical protein
MKAILVALAAVIAIGGYATTSRAHDDNGPITGVLIDQACGTKQMTKDDPQAAAAKHPKACCMKDACASSGFAVIQGKHMYKLDDAGAKMAKEYLAKEDSTTLVTVGGTIKDDTIAVTSLKAAEKH